MITNNLLFWKDKKVFITGHTGFKGSWLCRILINAGAKLTGYALKPSTHPNLNILSGVESNMNSIIGDISNIDMLVKSYIESQPDIVIHMAAQPIVKTSYINPKYTYETNVMGTVNILECLRLYPGARSFLNVTTDKVYLNNEWEWGYRENEPLDGFDPYSNSKSCSELVTHSYKNSFFAHSDLAISTARAGNVIGGGDFAEARIIPDCVRAILEQDRIIIRNPNSIRPYQHVLECLFAYLMILEQQYNKISYAGYYNVGPDEADCITTGQLADLFCHSWGNNLSWENLDTEGFHEANYLKLDCSKLKQTFGWKPKTNIVDAVNKTVEWTREYVVNGNIGNIMDKQITEFWNLVK